MTTFANGSTTIATGQVAIVTTNTAVPLGADILVKGVVLSANPANSGPLLIGPSTVTTEADGNGPGFVLNPGQTVNWGPWGNGGFSLAHVSVNGTAGDWLSFLGN